MLFNSFFKIAKKRLPSLSIYFFIYVFISILLGTSSQKNIEANFQSKSLNICVIDEDNSKASAALTRYLGSIHNLKPLENNPDTLQDHLYYRDISYICTITKGFEEKLLSGESDEVYTCVKIPGSATGYFVDLQISQYTKLLTLFLSGGSSMPEAIEKTDPIISNTAGTESIVFQADTDAVRKEVFFHYQYLPYIFIVIFICGLAPLVITFHEKNIAARTNCSSTSLGSQNIQIVICCILYSLVVWLLFFLIGVFIYKTEMFHANALFAMLNSFAALLIAAALAFFISNFSINFNTANMISNILGLGLAFLCGVFVPQDMLSESVLKIARFLPTYWYIKANNMLGGLSSEAFSLSSFWKAFGIQLLFAAALVSAALALSRLNRQRKQ